jgi:hypothetical protein
MLIAITSLLAIPISANATEAQPYGITNFTVQTIGETKVVPLDGGKEIGGEHFEISNQPASFTQAGGHPWALAATLEFASEEVKVTNNETALVPTRDPKDVVVDLPPGLLGDPVAVPQCSLSQALNPANGKCPPATQVGTFRIRHNGGKEELGPIVNVVPETGQSAEFAFEDGTNIDVVLTGHIVRTSAGYEFTVVSNGIPSVELTKVETTFWGIPADASHDAMRGKICAQITPTAKLFCKSETSPTAGIPAVPFLTMPTNCAAGEQQMTVRSDSWEQPGFVRENSQYEGYVTRSTGFPAVTGCELLQFSPSIEIKPNTLLADAPVGLGVNIQVPQTQITTAPATPQLKDAVVTLPEGLSISPGIVDGIQACNESGPEGINFTGPLSEEKGVNGELQLAAGHCPDASIVGTAKAITPLLATPVEGHVYLARPACGGAGQSECTPQDAATGRLYRLYLELGGTGDLASTGVNIKVEGKVEANLATGQLTTRFEDNPQAPLSELKIELNGGPRAPLDNPATCGPATTTADFTPWSSPSTSDATPSTHFDVEGCAAAPGLTPGFTAGTVTPEAGAFTAFTVNLTRQDREQFLSGVQVHTPPGLLGMLATVPLCNDTDAQSGHCPQTAKIGTTRVASGAGSHPFEIGGDVYLTTGYGGAPFGLSIVTHAVAGPFNLGLVVVRARIAVDPVDSSLTITTDQTGPYAIPQIIFGVPLRLKQVTVDIDRPNFMFNPTNCAAQQITAVVSGSQNAVAHVASPFAAGGCRSLAFKPQFKVSTSGHTSKANGASLDAKVSFPAGSMGSEANIAYVKVDLPKQLPSRLTTLQKACIAATFDANPAACPPQSVVGIARASTPVLPVGLQGPVYFVSHGGEAFPSLIVVLQGDGVRVDLTGSTFISKAGVTSSTFKTVPDVPINSFELYLPQGRFSALAANGNLCALTSTVAVKRKVTQRVHGRTVHRTITTHVKKPASLLMPTEFIGQNGAVLNQNTTIAVTRCAKAKKAKAKKKTKAKKATKVGYGRTSK